MDLIEKIIYLHYKDDDIMTISVDAFLNIIFEEIKTQTTYFESIIELDEYLSSIKKIIEFDKDDKEYIHLNLSDDENILTLFAYGLHRKSKDICDYYNI